MPQQIDLTGDDEEDNVVSDAVDQNLLSLGQQEGTDLFDDV